MRVILRICPARIPCLLDFLGRAVATGLSLKMIVHEAIESLKCMSATGVSRFSHQRAWNNAKTSELIPYNSVWLSDDPINQSDIDEAMELIERHGWHDV